MSQTSVTATLDEAAIDALFANVDQDERPGVAVAVAIHGIPVYRKGFGLANMELPVLLAPSMRMRIGSTTKHFAALAYMLLCEEGRVGIGDPIGKYVPDLHPVSQDVTMRQLMGHTSGLRDAMTVGMMLNGHDAPLTDRELVAAYRTIDDVEFAPGASWSYNNGGYILLTAAIEAITGETLDDVLRARIFEPAGMADTMLRRWDSGFVPNSATLHFFTPGGFTRDKMGMEISGAGGIVSTMDDMLRWLKHMDAPVVGSAETWRLMKEPHRLNNGRSTGYGLGLITDTYRGVTTLSHGGGVVAGNSQMIKVPAAGLDISIATNRADVSAADLANKIIDACLEGLGPAPQPAMGKAREGSFVSARSGRVLRLLAQGDMQMMALDGGPPLPLFKAAAERLTLPPIMSFFQQEVAIEEDLVRLTDFGNEDVFEGAASAPDATLEASEGTYRSEAAQATLEVRRAGAAWTLVATGGRGRVQYQLSPIATAVWQATPTGPFAALGAVARFNPDGSLELTAGRMAKLRFHRIAR
jgi:D-aminopeptidase